MITNSIIANSSVVLRSADNKRNTGAIEQNRRNGGKAAPHSHFDEPITRTENRYSGNSRRWGDAPPATQLAVIRAIVDGQNRRGREPELIAFGLAVARTESGFNPDAAARTTSASGVGQLIDSTGKTYGLGEENRFEIEANVTAMLTLLEECNTEARARLPDSASPEKVLELTYALYHDGPTLKFGGAEIARTSVLPWTEKFRNVVKRISSD